MPIFHSAPLQVPMVIPEEHSHNSSVDGSSQHGPSSIHSGSFMPIKFSSRPEKAPSTNAEMLIANPNFS